MSDKRRPYRWLLALGLLALAVTATGMLRLFSQSPPGQLSPGAPGASTPVRGPGVVCFGRVDVLHGPAALAPLQPGRVVKIVVRENEAVVAGAPLLVLDDALVRPRLKEARAGVKAAKAQLAKAEVLPAQYGAKLAQQQSAIAAFGQRVAGANDMLQLKQKLRKEKQISAEELAAAQAQWKEMQALRDVEEKKLEELKLYDPQLDVRAAQAEVDRVEAKLAEAEHALAECTLKAPEAGTVLRLLAAPGDVVGGPAPRPALFFAADGPRVVRTEVEQEFADQVVLGQSVSVEDEANAKALAAGKVTALSGWFTPRRLPLMEPTRYNSTRTLEAIVTLDPGHPPLRLGQRVRVRFPPTR